LEAVRLLVRELVVLAVLALFLELLLPPGDMRRYVKMVFGLLVIVAVVQAVARPWQSLAQDFAALSIEETKAVASTPFDQGQRMWEKSKEQALIHYEDGLCRQVKALAGMHPDIEVLNVEVLLYNEESGTPAKIKEIVLVVSRRTQEVREVKIGEGVDKEEQTDWAEQLRTTIADFYSLNLEQVTVIKN